MSALLIRPRAESDDERIAFVVRRAFGSEAEVQLVRDLRAEGAMICEVVAEHEGAGLIGHVAFSRLDVRAGETTIAGAALAPLAVLPTHQRHGAGRALVAHGLEQLRAMKIGLGVVLGDPAYYAHFGFSRLLGRFLETPYSGDGLQALELTAGALGKRQWHVTYPAAFAKLA